MAFAILRVAKLKTPGQISAVGGHNARTRPTANADTEVVNRVLVGRSEDDAWPAVQARITAAGAKLRRNGVLACEVFLGASPEFFRPQGGGAGSYDPARLQAWEGASMQWLRDEWGTDNVVSAVVHLDETTPHLQAVVVPIDPASGRLNAARWLNGRKALSQMQDRYAAAVKPLGLERGIRGSTAEHTEVREWYGHLQGPTPRVPAPTVAAPRGMLEVMTDTKREAYAQGETARLQELQGPQLDALQTRARAHDLAVKQRDEQAATAKRLAGELAAARTALAAKDQELARLRAYAEAFRPVPLLEAATWYTMEELVAAGVTISPDREHRFRVIDRTTGRVVGRNAIDLAMRIGKTDYRGAILDLCGRIGPEKTLAAGASAVMEETAQAKTVVVSAPVMAKRLERAVHQARGKPWAQWEPIFKTHGFTLHAQQRGQGVDLSVVEVFSKVAQTLSHQVTQVALVAIREADAEARRRYVPPSWGPSR